MTLDIRIMNMRHHNEFLKVPTYRIDRATVLGNPYYVGRDGTREQVIEKYRLWLPKQYGRDLPLNHIKEYLDAMLATAKRGPIQLACWCSPLPCHGDVIKDFLNDLVQTKQ